MVTRASLNLLFCDSRNTTRKLSMLSVSKEVLVWKRVHVFCTFLERLVGEIKYIYTKATLLKLQCNLLRYVYVRRISLKKTNNDETKMKKK